MYRDKNSPGGVVETETVQTDCGPVEVTTATVEEEREGWGGMRLRDTHKTMIVTEATPIMTHSVSAHTGLTRWSSRDRDWRD